LQNFSFEKLPGETRELPALPELPSAGSATRKEKEGNLIKKKDREKFEKIKQFYIENNLSYYASVPLVEALERLAEEYKGKI